MSQDHPNILLIQADQMTPFLTGAYGHPVVQTPNLDRLVREGVRFDAAYTPHPVCAPARACMVTGKWVSHCGAWDNAALLPADQPTFAHYLTNVGYDTVFSGKMHFVGPDQLHGFRRRFSTNIYPADYRWTVSMTEKGVPFDQAYTYIGDAVHVDRWNSNMAYDEEAQCHALAYLHARGETRRRDEARRRDGGEMSRRPWFLFMSYHHPHEVFWPPKDLWDLYEDAEIDVPEFPDNLAETYSALDRWLNEYHGVALPEELRNPDSIRRVRRAYYALVTYVDRKVGELLATLEREGFMEDTVIVFTSDHGDMLCEKGMVQKRTFYEWSARVPLILRFPDGWKAGTVIDEPVNLIDLMPTFLDLGGVPGDERLDYDGRSLIGLLDGSDAVGWETFSENHSDSMIEAPCFMLRRGAYKYVYIHGHEDQLFDLASDPREWNNLVHDPDHAAVVAEMRGRILEVFDPDEIKA
ncbi:MAG: sulfatase-like hydrolase/transferase, partial [Anaerolineae bacterium]